MIELEFKKFIEYIKDRVIEELPGLSSHKKMAPIVDEEFFRTFKATENAKNSAVLIPIIKKNDKWQILFTLRSTNISHSGQISFPGGRCEANETKVETALRETYEETGIINSDIEIIGELSDLFVPPSNSIISPVIGMIQNPIETIINFDEVQEIFYVPFSEFLDKKNHKLETWQFNNVNVDVPFFNVHHSTPLWGATAMILQELLDLWDEFEDMK